jgi:hypothetical protein
MSTESIPHTTLHRTLSSTIPMPLWTINGLLTTILRAPQQLFSSLSSSKGEALRERVGVQRVAAQAGAGRRRRRRATRASGRNGGVARGRQAAARLTLNRAGCNGRSRCEPTRWRQEGGGAHEAAGCERGSRRGGRRGGGRGGHARALPRRRLRGARDKGGVGPRRIRVRHTPRAPRRRAREERSLRWRERRGQERRGAPVGLPDARCVRREGAARARRRRRRQQCAPTEYRSCMRRRGTAAG